MSFKLLSMSTVMTLVHFILSILLFITSIVVFVSKNLIHFNGLTILLLTVWLIFTGLHGWKYYEQYYFMYTFTGRGLFYFFIGLIVWGSNESSFFSGVVSLLFMLFGIGSFGIGTFSESYEPPRPLLGPPDFKPFKEKNTALASQSDFEDPFIPDSLSADSRNSNINTANNPFTI
ncbi:hypothetical protein DLAC_04183 [Tieghemostelium lacteum]|uniref:Transmembrane protein n=1 Tax=Tieghemostelium lacteum TaxID=361077 RepID=A0A151ZSB0_TIELA|nr:hypothetical protein DLAC_04183 [Tieghemostelium lacteum]|eukprot:KYQ96873.1 hypothetical protein DLAC_04183 [Tieghemostelium lacteum]